MIIDFLVPNIQCQCVCVCVFARASVHVWVHPALLRHILRCIFGTDIKIHRKVTETEVGRGFESRAAGRAETVDSQAAADVADKQISHRLHHHTAPRDECQMPRCKPVWLPEVGGRWRAGGARTTAASRKKHLTDKEAERESGGQTYIQQKAHYLRLPTEGRLVKRRARLGLSVDVDASLDQQP